MFSGNIHTPVGTCVITLSKQGLHDCTIGKSPAAQRSLVRDSLSDAENRLFEEAARAISNYFLGDLPSLEELPVVPAGTPFQQQVWAALRRIQPGETLSYGALADSINMPGAARAVGAACGANPIWLFIPCHRVIAADGTLGGYGGGLETKRWLLDHERRLSAFTQQRAQMSA
jgi:methylated-DNA-[protein]-cysteine S-methyltransferase